MAVANGVTSSRLPIVIKPVSKAYSMRSCALSSRTSCAINVVTRIGFGSIVDVSKRLVRRQAVR